jgi:hypothetical protein
LDDKPGGDASRTVSLLFAPAILAQAYRLHRIADGRVVIRGAEADLNFALSTLPDYDSANGRYKIIVRPAQSLGVAGYRGVA